MTEQEERLVRVEGQIERTKLLAQYWIAMATTGATKKRQVSRPTGGKDDKGNYVYVELTDDEKVQDALMTANTHIHNLDELYEGKIRLMKGEL